MDFVLNDLQIHFSDGLVWGAKLIHFLKLGYAKDKIIVTVNLPFVTNPKSIFFS